MMMMRRRRKRMEMRMRRRRRRRKRMEMRTRRRMPQDLGLSFRGTKYLHVSHCKCCEAVTVVVF